MLVSISVSNLKVNIPLVEKMASLDEFYFDSTRPSCLLKAVEFVYPKFNYTNWDDKVCH